MVTKGKRKERLDRGVKVRSEGVYAIASWSEAMYLIAPRLFLMLAMVIIPLVMPSIYHKRLICLLFIYALLAISFDFLTNYVGLVCLGGAMFMGVGGYIAGSLNAMLGLPPVLTIIVATLGGAAICTILLLPCLPLRGIYFAIVTLVYPLLLGRIIEATRMLGGTDGMPGLSTYPSPWVDLYLVIGVTALVLFGLRRLVNEDMGLVFRGIKDNDQTVTACGVNITAYRTRAVYIASAVGCFAGAYLCHLYGWVGLSFFALDFSIIPIAAAIVGGMGTLVGPLLGSAIIVPLSEILRAFGGLRIVFYALILILFIAFRPEGLMNYFQRKYAQFEHWIEV
ncbi:MAG: branched-chain amino acid ABC transporter permease [Deltaproteobacteria bacterium]|nr:MAG: branched-chain amino acid ABC transporter permease [Deltaproteobacteria bacterium]